MHGMVWIGWGMLALGGVWAADFDGFSGDCAGGAVRFRREARRQEELLEQRPEFLPAVSLFKPLHGAEAGLEGNLRRFYEQDYLKHAAANGLPATCGWGFAGGGAVLCAERGGCGAGDCAAGGGGLSGGDDAVLHERRAVGGECEGVLAGDDGEGGDA